MWLFERIRPHEHFHYDSNLVKCVFNYLWKRLKTDKLKTFQTSVFSVVHL